MISAALIEMIAETTAAAFGLAVDLLYKLGQIDEATVQNAKTLAAERIMNYDTAKAAKQAQHWRIAQGLEP